MCPSEEGSAELRHLGKAILKGYTLRQRMNKKEKDPFASLGDNWVYLCLSLGSQVGVRERMFLPVNFLLRATFSI